MGLSVVPVVFPSSAGTAGWDFTDNHIKTFLLSIYRYIYLYYSSCALPVNIDKSFLMYRYNPFVR